MTVHSKYLKSLLPGILVLALAGCQKCKVEVIWDKHEAIRITQALRWHPSDADTLKCMIPGSRLAFQVKATDKDLLIQRCKDECVNQQGDHHFVLPDTPRIRWTKVNGNGQFQQNEGETVFYKIRTDTGVDTLNYVIDTPGDKATDDVHITGTITVTATLNADTGCLKVRIDQRNPNRPTHITEFQDSNAPICKADPPQWTADVAITGTLSVSNPLCPRTTVLLSAAFRDKDQVKLVCDSPDCDKGELIKKYSDVLTATWRDGGAGGTFPFGNTGTQVIYTVPDRVQRINFQVSVDDSGQQFNDPAGRDTERSDSTMRFDLEEIDTSATNPYRKNVTTGQNFTWRPKWDPNNADVRKIKWETDIGGPTGEIKRKVCSDRRLTSNTAGLRFHDGQDDEKLNVAWRKHSHLHGEKQLTKVHAWAQQCGDACFCDDDTWTDSDFLTGNDKDKYKLYFSRDGTKDDGRVEDLATVNAHDSWGEDTTLRGVNVPNWFTHWSTQTYNASMFNHAVDPPKLKYRGGVAWLGLYDQNNEMVYLSEEAAKSSDRRRFRGAGWIITSDHKYFEARRTEQRAYNLVGHKLASKVYLHEIAHYEAITRNWAAGGAWRTRYGALSTTETQAFQRNLFGALPRITTTLVGTGNFGQRRHGRDVMQKFTVTINYNVRNPAGGVRQLTVGPVTDAWIPSHPALRRQAVAIPGGQPFIVRTATDKWEYRNNQLTHTRLPNDPDKDYIPNAMEDQVGTKWDDRRSHRGHARYNPPQGIAAADYMADQEYWADHTVVGTGTWGLDNATWASQIDPGNHTHDWANPGAQSDPPAQ